MGRPKKVIEYTTDADAVRNWAGRFEEGHQELSSPKQGMAGLRRQAADECIDTEILELCIKLKRKKTAQRRTTWLRNFDFYRKVLNLDDQPDLLDGDERAQEAPAVQAAAVA